MADVQRLRHGLPTEEPQALTRNGGVWAAPWPVAAAPDPLPGHPAHPARLACEAKLDRAEPVPAATGQNELRCDAA